MIALLLWITAFAVTIVACLQSLITGDPDAIVWALLALVVVQLGRD